MFNFFRNNKLPYFWKEYLKTFKQKPSKTIETTRFIVFDTETTGLDIVNDRILSIGAVAIFNNTINVADSFEVYLKQQAFKAETVEIHGILKDGNLEKYSEKETLEKLDLDLVQLESSSEDADLLNEIFRSFHTVKGTSGFLGLVKMQALTHRLEDILNKLRK